MRPSMWRAQHHTVGAVGLELQTTAEPAAAQHTHEEPEGLVAPAVVHIAVAARTARVAGYIAGAGHTVEAVRIVGVPLEHMSSDIAKTPAPTALLIVCRII